MASSSPWREYEWKVGKVGRQKGQREGLDSGAPVTRTWLRRGWIAPVRKEPVRKERMPVTQSFDGPPRHRAMRTDKTK